MAIRNSKGQAGFTLIELLIAIAIIGLLAAIAIPRYQGYVDQRDVEQAKTEIQRLEHKIRQYSIRNNELPSALTDIEPEPPLDPWKNEYKYLVIASAKKGKIRKDKHEVPVNSDYDLYSEGKDGKSTSTFRAKSSWDDVVRANNGRFIGLASDY